jgi:hypothetical protein
VTLALIPHAPPSSDRLHVWVGMADTDPAPPLTWTLDGTPVQPTPLRPMQKLLRGPLAAKANTAVHSGFFEIANLTPATRYAVEVTAGSSRVRRSISTLPREVSRDPQQPFNLLLLSCFHRDQDRTGLAGAVLTQLEVAPDVTVFAGDQVYLDLPTTQNLDDNTAWLANKFQEDYIANWLGFGDANEPFKTSPGYPQVLALAPGTFMPDDHEYWNNYPFAATVIQNSWSAEGRARWKVAAETLYRGFQQTGAVPFGSARTVDVEPLSILILDTRSQRSMTSRANPHDLLGAGGRLALTQWIDRLVQHASDQRPWFGMLVAGQSFFRSPAGHLTGAIADYEFADYEADYRFMVEQIERVTSVGLPMLLATGDVHWSRVLRAVNPTAAGADLYEIVSSPASLVASVGVDEVKEAWGAIKGFFGSTERWPRHADPESPPPRFGTVGQYSTTVLAREEGNAPAAMRGNQASMLRFVQVSGGLNVEVQCYPLSEEPTFNAAERWSTSFRLRPPRNQ